jgi:hypothetical protein
MERTMNCHQDHKPTRGAPSLIAVLFAVAGFFFLILPVAEFFIGLAVQVGGVL